MFTSLLRERESERDRERERARARRGGWGRELSLIIRQKKLEEKDLITNAQTDIDAIYYEQIETRGHNLIFFWRFLIQISSQIDAISPKQTNTEARNLIKFLFFFGFLFAILFSRKWQT